MNAPSRLGIAAGTVMLWLLVSVCSVHAQSFKVVTTFTVIADLARQVAGDVAEVVSITKAGVDIHNYQPTARDLLRGYDADLLLWNGMNLELWFKQFTQQLPPIPQVTVSSGVTPISIAAGDYVGKANPHAWMSVSNAQIYIDNILQAFVEHDPDHAAQYRANAARYSRQLHDTIAPLRQQLNDIPEHQRWLVTSEGAFSYFARDFGLKELYLWPMNADQLGTPQQVRHVIDRVRQFSIPVLFSESTVSPKPMQQVARETGSLYGGVLYVDSLSTADGPVPTYLDLLKVTTQTIVAGFRRAGVITP